MDDNTRCVREHDIAGLGLSDLSLDFCRCSSDVGRFGHRTGLMTSAQPSTKYITNKEACNAER
jgi:hypothetical protein